MQPHLFYIRHIFQIMPIIHLIHINHIYYINYCLINSTNAIHHFKSITKGDIVTKEVTKSHIYDSHFITITKINNKHHHVHNSTQIHVIHQLHKSPSDIIHQFTTSYNSLNHQIHIIHQVLPMHIITNSNI